MKRSRPFRFSNQGFSLMELVIVAGLMGLLALAVAKVMSGGEKGLADARIRQDFQNDLNVLSGGLQKFMTSNDLRFFAFTGGIADSPFPNPKPMSRFLIPQPGRCRDLSVTKGCAEQSAFLYVHYDKSSTRSLLGRCLLPPDPSDVNGPWLLLVDMDDKTYGEVSYHKPTNTIKTEDPAGTQGTQSLNLDAKTIVAAFDPPKASLFVVAGKPDITKLRSIATGVVYAGGAAIDESCEAQLPPDPPAIKKRKLNRILEIPVRPFVLTQFTGLSYVTTEEVQASTAVMPQRIAPVEVRSVGAMPKDTPAGKFDFGMSRCKLTDDLATLECEGNAIANVGPVDQLRIDEIFAVSLFNNAGAPEPENRFELRAAGMTPSPSCASPNCRGLSVQGNGNIPGLVSADERLDRLFSSGFSLIKQENLQDLKFRVITDLSTQKGESFNVHFP